MTAPRMRNSITRYQSSPMSFSDEICCKCASSFIKDRRHKMFPFSSTCKSSMGTGGKRRPGGGGGIIWKLGSNLKKASVQYRYLKPNCIRGGIRRIRCLSTGTCFIRMHRRWLHKLCIRVVECFRMIIHILIFLRLSTLCALRLLLPHSMDTSSRVNVIIDCPVRAFPSVGKGTRYFLEAWVK